WELRNLGFGDVARTRARRAQYDEANLHVTEMQARVAAEIVAAAKLAATRLRSLGDAQGAVKEATEMWRRLEEASFGLAAKQRMYDALEPLLAEQSLAQSRAAYLNEVIE